MSENQNDLPLWEAEVRTQGAITVGVRYPLGTTTMESVPTKRIQLCMMPGPDATDNSRLVLADRDLDAPSVTKGRPRTILLSHAPTDADMAEAVLARLQAAGHLIWIDRSRTQDGWRGSLLDAVWSCDAVIFLVSAASAACERVSREVHLAGSEKVPVLPLLLEPTNLPEDLGWYLTGSVKPIDFRFDFETAMTTLLGTIENLPRRWITRPRWLATMSGIILACGAMAYFALRWLLGG